MHGMQIHRCNCDLGQLGKGHRRIIEVPRPIVLIFPIIIILIWLW